MSPALCHVWAVPVARRTVDDDPFDPDADPDRFDPDALDDEPEPEPEPGDFWFDTDDDDQV